MLVSSPCEHASNMTASKLQAQINSYLKSKGYYSFTTVVSSVRGVPDIIACSPLGNFLAIEVKYKKDKLSPIQIATLNKLKSLGATCIVAKTLQDVKDALDVKVKNR